MDRRKAYPYERSSDFRLGRCWLSPATLLVCGATPAVTGCGNYSVYSPSPSGRGCARARG